MLVTIEPLPGGFEPPTFRLTAERANQLRHGSCQHVFPRELLYVTHWASVINNILKSCILTIAPLPGGFEPPTFRLTAERANQLRHGTCQVFFQRELLCVTHYAFDIKYIVTSC